MVLVLSMSCLVLSGAWACCIVFWCVALCCCFCLKLSCYFVYTFLLLSCYCVALSFVLLPLVLPRVVRAIMVRIRGECEGGGDSTVFAVRCVVLCSVEMSQRTKCWGRERAF